MLSIKDFVFKKASKEASELICESIFHWWDNFYQYGQITTTHFNENLFGSECQSSSIIQRTNGGTKDRRSETSGSRERVKE